MAFVAVVLSLWTGSTKSVSVCGINSAMVARPASGASSVGQVLYVTSLLLGSAAVTFGALAVGGPLHQWLPLQTRAMLIGSTLVGLGGLELTHGPWLLPHVPWAVPRHWASGPGGLVAFGLIRGVAIFNHSPFASMHAWLLTLVFLGDLISPVAVAMSFAAGLALWSGVALYDWVSPRQRLFRWSDHLLLRTRFVARMDGIALVSAGGLVLLVGLG